MAKFLDLEGLNYFWAKIKSWVLERFAYKSDLDQKLSTLVSGQNIKTINNLNILGPGNIEIQGGSGTVDSVNGKTGNVVLDAEDVGALPDSTTIPTKVSDLTNDSNFSSVSINSKVSSGTNIADITIDGTTTLLYAPTNEGGGGSITIDDELSTTSENPVQNKVITQALDEKADSSDIPDVSNFITNTVNNLTNYYLKSETYTKAEVAALIGAIQQFHYEIYATLPASGESNVLYLIGPTGSGSDRYEEYVYSNSVFTKIGDTSIDLSGYVTTSALSTALAGYCPMFVNEGENYIGGWEEGGCGYIIGADGLVYAIGESNAGGAEDKILATTDYVDDAIGDLAAVATSGDYDDLTNKPTIPTVPVQDVTVGGTSVVSNGTAVIPQEVFWAEYGVTTSSELDTQLALGKILACRYDDRVHIFTRKIPASASYNYYWFAAVANDMEYYLRLRDDNQTWYAQNYQIQFTNNRVSSWQSTPDNVHYPTEKLVKNSIDAVDKVFWATYGTTTAAEIDAAVAAGKLVVVKVVYNTSIENILYYTNIRSSANPYFSCVSDNIIYCAICNRTSGTWSNTRIFLQAQSDKVSTISGNETNTIKYPNTKAVADALGKWGVISQTQTWASGYGSYTLSNVVNGLIPQVFIDRWVSLVTDFGGGFNETSGYFELNGLLDITYEDAIRIVDQYSPFPDSEGWRPNSAQFGDYGKFKARTTIPNNVSTASTYPYLTHNKYVEIVKFSINPGLQFTSFIQYGCYRMKKLLDVIKVNADIDLFYWYALEECYFILSKNFKASSSKYLSLASVVYMVEKAINTTAITITLHADALARCTADTTEYEYNDNTYTGIVALATAKNITLASA